MAGIRKRYRPGTQQLLGYQAQFRAKGAQPKSKTYKSHAEADLWLAEKKREHAVQKNTPPPAPQPPPVKHHTVGDAIDRFLRELPDEKSTRNRDLKSILPFWKVELGEVGLKALSKDHINPAIDKLKKKKRGGGTAAPATVRRKVRSQLPLGSDVTSSTRRGIT